MTASPHLALVAGAGDATGAAVARTLAEAGWSVACVDVIAAKAHEVAAEIGGTAVVADLFEPDEVERAVDESVRALGGLDTVVDVVGILEPARFRVSDDRLWERSIDRTLTHAVRLTRTCLSRLSGVPSSFTYVASISGDFAAFNQAAYAAGKAALQSLARSVAIEHAPDVRANTVSPGAVGTPRLLKSYSPEVLQKMASSIPLERLATLDEVAKAVRFLCSSDASYITATDLRVDGGASAKFPIYTGDHRGA